MAFEVRFDDRATDDIVSIFAYVAERAGDEVAVAYVRRLEARCRSMGDAPLTGTPRDDVSEGLRTAPFERRATIAYAVKGDVVTIRLVLHAGRDIANEF